MYTERKATGLFVLADFLCDNVDHPSVDTGGSCKNSYLKHDFMVCLEGVERQLSS